MSQSFSEMFACCRGGGRGELICLMEEEEREVDLI